MPQLVIGRTLLGLQEEKLLDRIKGTFLYFGMLLKSGFAVETTIFNKLFLVVPCEIVEGRSCRSN